MSEKDLTPSIDLSCLNDRQRKIAETLDEPLFVEAGAGSGKTFTLTQRVAWALSPGSGEGGAPFLDGLEQVLVITFTEAAAREIKERVRSTLRRAGMGEAALAVDEAWISTIHGMCRRILSRHALDLGLDPSFSVIADSRQAALFDRAMDDVMRAARSEAALAPVFAEFELGAYAPQSGYTGAMGLVERLVREGGSLPGGLDDLVPAPRDPGAVSDAVRDLAMRVEELGALRLTPAAAAKVGPSLEALRRLEGASPAELTPEAVSAALREVSLPQARGAIKSEVAAAKSALALARAEAEFARVAPLAEGLLELARRVRARYDELKLDKACLDNDDLVRLALLAVRDHEEVRRAYAGRFRLVMVDEFQDTDEMQLELIGLLSGNDARHLCTVGDAQQSIYRFRGADVGVFRGRGAQVDQRNSVRLDTNYRSHADVLALVERVCAGGAAGRGVMPDFMHLDASPTRKDRYRARDLPRIDIEVCAGQGRSGRATRHQTAAMAAQVADALARYRDAGERPGDMALLLGVTTHADAYIDAIRARGMECVVTGGSTFTSTDEVKVVRALLHALANPADTQSGLFPLLASEMFGLDANDFCELGTRPQVKLDAPTKRTIDRGLADMAFYRDAAPSGRLELAHEVLARALDDVRRRPVADVVADVVRDSGWLARLEAGGAEGLARAANVLAAVRYVRDLTVELGLGAARAATEFDLWLASSKVPPASLAGGEGEAGEGTVRVMTVHASKGLEFGVCAVAECWGNPRGDAQIASGPAAGGGRVFVLRPAEAPRLADVDPEELEESADRSRGLPLAARYLALRAADDAAEAQERARLLYVALTRAREALVVGVSAASGKGGVSSALAASTLRALSGGDWDPAPGVRELDYGGSAPARLRCVTVESQGSGAGAPVVADSAGTLPGFDGELPTDAAALARLGVDVVARPASGDPAAFDLYERDPAAHPGAPGTWRAREGVFSYSSVRALLDAGPAPRALPTREEREAEAVGAPTAEDADRATNLGSAFHELAQAMVESGRAADDARVAAQVRRWNLSPRAEGRLRASLARWEGSRIRAEALSWPLARAEVPFFQRVESDYGDHLEGAIDLLCTDAAGRRALVVDYKTGDAGLSPDEVRERHAMQAEFYAGVLLREGFERVTCAFVCVERDDPASPGEPLVARYEFGGGGRRPSRRGGGGVMLRTTMTRRALVLAAALGASALAGCSQEAGAPEAAAPTPDEVLGRSAREAAAYYGRGFLTTLGAADELFSATSATPGTVEELAYSCHAYAVEEAEGRDDLVVEKRLLVYLPHGYDASTPHEVLYLLHGTAGDERYWLSDEEGNFGRSTRAILDALHDEGAISPTIVAAPSYYSVPEGFEVDRSMGGDDPYADLWPLHFWRELRDDVVPLVERSYATHATGDVSADALAASRDHRAFAGLSRGSMASVNSVMMHCLDWFSRVGSFSGAWADVDELRSALEGDFACYPVGFWYNGNGSLDFALADHEQFLRAALEALPDRLVDGENLAWVRLPGGEHSYPSWGTHLHNCLHAFFSA